MKKHIKEFKILLSVLFITISICSLSQNIGTTVGSVNSCPGAIIVPVSVNNCSHIGSISLVLNYNKNLLTYNGYQNVNSQLNGGLFYINAYNGQIIISWAAINGLNISNDTLLKLKFTGITGSSNLSWDTHTPGNCEYSDTLGNVIGSSYNNGSVTIYKVPTIASNPLNATITEGQSTNFSVNADGTNISYQWQIKSTIDGSSWNDLSNTSFYNNVNGNILYINSAILIMNNYQFRCIVSGSCSPSTISNPATLTVNQMIVVPPTVITTAGSATVCPGHVVIPITVQNFINLGSFSLALNYNSNALSFIGIQDTNASLANGSLSYNANNGKIYLSWVSLTGKTINDNDTLCELIFNGNSGSNNLTWDTQTSGNCEYSSINGVVIPSNYFNGNISFYDPPVISANPVNKTIIASQSTSFSVSASGTNLSYQWQVSINNGLSWNNLIDSANYSNVNSSTLNLSNVSLNMSEYRYRCIISGTCPSPKTSSDALLTVNPIPQQITISLIGQTTCPGNFVVPISTINFLTVSSFSFVIKYDKTVLTFLNVQNINPAINGQIYINDSLGNIFIGWASSTSCSISGNLLELNFSAAATGSSYLNWDNLTPGNCEITDSLGYIISTVYNNCNIYINQPPIIIQQPVNTTVTVGETATFDVVASGSGVTYQWQLYNKTTFTWSNYSTSNPLSLPNTNFSLNGKKYRCIVSGSCNPAVISNEVTLTVNPLPQHITVTAQNVSFNCVGMAVQPIFVDNMNNIGAFSMVLIYDTLSLQYKSYETFNTSFLPDELIVNNSGNKIYITWASATPRDFGTSILLNLTYTSSGNNTLNTWDTQTPGNCEISDDDGNIISTTFTNGTIATTQPANLILVPNITTVTGAFTPSTTDHYLIVRNTSGNTPVPLNGTIYNKGDVIANGTVVGYQSDTSFYDIGLSSNTLYYYYVFAVTYTGCSVGPVYLSTSPLSAYTTTFHGKILNFTAMFQEYYNTQTGMMNQTQGIDWNTGDLYNNFGSNIVDTLTVLIRKTNVNDLGNPYEIEYAFYGLNLYTDGTIAPIAIPVTTTGFYYIVIKHRNSIETWSDSIDVSNDTISYNFNTHLSQFAIDGGMYIDDNNLAYIWGGDVNQNGNLESEDATNIYVAAISDDETVNNGYVINDIDGNGNIDSQDYGLAYSNSLIGANVINPFSYQKKK